MTKTPPKKPLRRQRRRGDLPAGFAWRDGRPRWAPSPKRRGQGWRSCDLKDAWGRWLAKGPAIERAAAIAQAADAFDQGAPPPSAFAAFAPKGAATGASPKGVANPRSIGALIEEYQLSPRFQRLGARTQADYKSKLRRFVEVLAGSDDERKTASARALDVDVLLPPAHGEAGDFELERAYDVLRDQAGEHMAFGVLATVSAWCGWIVKRKRLWPTNPAALVERTTPGGRIVVYEWPELVALVRAADAAGLASIGDAIVLAVDLSWSQQDLLALTWGQVNMTANDAWRVKHRRIKTGVAGNPPLLPIGRARLGEIAGRNPGVKPLPAAPVIVCELTGRAWSADTFRHKFAEIRAAAARGDGLETIAEKQFRDLRDTAVTYCIEAGMSLEETCSRTLHDPVSAQAVISKHYGAIRQGVADAGAAKLEAHFAAKGYTFDPLLALPAPAASGDTQK